MTRMDKETDEEGLLDINYCSDDLRNVSVRYKGLEEDITLPRKQRLT